METTSLARIEEDIAKQKLTLSNLYAQKNSFSFVYRLPIEILTDVFIRCARDYYRDFDYPALPRWISISHVCRHWRNIALQCPSLWSYIPIVSRRWVGELLARSKKTPLKIRIMVPCNIYVFRDTLEKVMNNVERIQELKMHVPARRTIEEVLPKLSLPAPLLQNLTIQVETGSSDMSVIPLLFDGDTPVLRALELSHCPAPWYLLKLSSLTTLTLRGVPVQFQQNIEEFLATLGCMKDISHLHVERVLLGSQGFITSASFNTFHKIDLPRLSRLLIECPVSTAIAFIACVNIPINAEVRLGCIFEGEASLDNYTLLSSVLAQRFYAFAGPTQSNPTIRSLAIGRWNTPMLAFSALERDHESYISEPYISVSDSYTAYYTGWGRNVPLQICLCRLAFNVNSGCIISNICCTVPVPHVESLHVIEPSYSLDFWERILAHIQGLRYLKLSRGDLPGLASLLSLPSDDNMENLVGHADAGSSLVLAPALEELVLYDITFGIPVNYWDVPEEADDLPTLKAALATRTNPGVRLDMFECREYATSESDEDEDEYY